jgi:hypothetical protein
VSKPWLEPWEFIAVKDLEYGNTSIPDEDAKLMSAAPEMCRALLAVESAGKDDRGERCCPICGGYANDIFYGHEACAIDIALTKAGLDTQEKRDAARKEMGI